MKKIKVMHIHSDLKFIDRSTTLYDENTFENKIAIIWNGSIYKGAYKDVALYVKDNRNSINELISVCVNFDLIILYDLDLIKCYIANRLQEHIKIFWRFSGLELYGKMPEYVYSPLTKKAIYSQVILKKLIKIGSIFKQLIKWKTIYEYEFKKACSRVDYFLGLSKYEYDFLKQYWHVLPDFIQYPYRFRSSKLVRFEDKKNEVIVGNNRSAYNNHLELLNIIQNANNQNDTVYFLLFNYGQNNHYSKVVRGQAKKIKNVKIIENFLSIEEFDRLYLTISAFVLNGYRQMAMANVFQAIQSGVKLYLHRKNVIFDWLKYEGILVFTIDDFTIDIEANNIKLTKEEAIYNSNRLEKLALKFSKENYFYELYKIVDVKL